MRSWDRIQVTAAWLGLAGFFALVGLSAGLYPGGHRFDERHPGFNFLYNFLCDLFSARSYSGRENPGRPFAIAGTYSLAVGLLVFWSLIPALFPPGALQAKLVVRAAGIAAILAALFVPTPAHDWSIYVAVPLGLVAFGASILALKKADERLLAGLGLVSVAVCVVNYLNFVFRMHPRSLPIIQKLALLSFIAWVLCTLVRITAVTRDPAPRIGVIRRSDLRH